MDILKLVEEVKKINEEREKQCRKSAWSRGVSFYTYELLENIKNHGTVKTIPELRDAAKNGAEDWNQYSWGGCSLYYDCDICEALCSKSEQIKKDFGRLKPNSHENWLDVQARALNQAFNRIKRAFYNLDKEGV